MTRAAIAFLLLLALGPAAARAGAAQRWHSQQPAGEGGFPLLGEVGDLECWHGEVNRCLLITAGNSGVGAGLFAYDGSAWYRYSTVCGGHGGRIAWAGPDEFWTVSDQQVGQATTEAPSSRFAISLCHFKDGQVVASYGEPIGVANSYRHMDAAACAGPSDCWFGGERLPEAALNPGAFHLHWNGSSIAAVPSPTVPSELSDPGRQVSALAYHRGSFYEGVDVQADDIPNGEEEKEGELGPSFLHRVDSAGSTPFQPLFGQEAFDYGGAFAEAGELDGFDLTGGEGEDLWAIAGSTGPEATVTVLRLGEEGLIQQPLEDPGEVLGHEIALGGAASEPGGAWLGFRHRDAVGEAPELLSSPARLTRIQDDGTVGAEITLPAEGEEVGGEPIGHKGVAGPIACPAAEQCWMATHRGWLFHLGPDPERQSDPAMHVLITSRPRDDSLPVLPPLELPEDTSGTAPPPPQGEEELPSQFEELPKRKPALLSHIEQRLVGGTLLELSFTLSAKAHVQLLARRKGEVVAKTRRYTMERGPHSLRLRLDPKRWPTKLDLEAEALKGKGSK